jgi:hypothetical protein
MFRETGEKSIFSLIKCFHKLFSFIFKLNLSNSIFFQPKFLLDVNLLWHDIIITENNVTLFLKDFENQKRAFNGKYSFNYQLSIDLGLVKFNGILIFL